MTTDLLARSVLLTAVSAPVILLSACGSSAATSAGPPASSTAPVAASSAPVISGSGRTSGAPFGAGCGALASSGSGGPGGMAGERLTDAAAHVPALAGLVAAVARAQLADSLDSQRDITVLAPANPAFAAVPRSTLHSLLGDTATLTRLLTHHVIEGRLSPDQLAGTHTTLANDTVSITGAGEKFTISGDQTMLKSRPATVVCGNLRTANATVYVIDQVLAPKR